MIHVLLLAALSFGQEVNTSSFDVVGQIKFNNLSESVRDIQSGRPTLVSSPTFRGIVTANAFTFGDATTQTTAAPLSTFTLSGAISSTLNDFDLTQCVAGSTITLNCATTCGIFFSFSGRMLRSVSDSSGSIGFFRNGELIFSFELQFNTANYYRTASFSYVNGALASGSHSFCLTGGDSGQAGTFNVTGRTMAFRIY